MHPTPESPGNIATFNILHGFPEALVRGMRSSFLKDADYHHLTQCESLDDIRLNMTESDYNEVLADSATLTPASLQKAAIEKVRFFIILFIYITCTPSYDRTPTLVSSPSPPLVYCSSLRSSSTCVHRPSSHWPRFWTLLRTNT